MGTHGHAVQHTQDNETYRKALRRTLYDLREDIISTYEHREFEPVNPLLSMAWFPNGERIHAMISDMITDLAGDYEPSGVVAAMVGEITRRIIDVDMVGYKAELKLLVNSIESRIEY